LDISHERLSMRKYDRQTDQATDIEMAASEP